MALLRNLIRSAAFAALLVVLTVLGAPACAAEDDKGVVASLISRALSSPSMSVSIGAVDGVLSSDSTISDIVLSDRDGPWLKIDKVRLIWSRLALLRRRLEVDQLTIGHVDFLRRPLPPSTPPPPDAGPQTILPELPLKVIVKTFAVRELSLGEAVVGVAARLDASGAATLGPPSEGLDLRLTSRRLDAPGQFGVLLAYVPATDKLTVNLNFDEPAGGLFAHAANLPGLPPVKLTFDGAGPLDSFDAKLDFTAGPDIWAKGQVVVARQATGRKLTLDLNSRIEGLAPAIIRPVFAGETTLKGDVLFNDDSSVALPGGLHLVSQTARLDFEGGKSADSLLDVRVHAGAIPGSRKIGKLDLNATLSGLLSGPKVDGVLDAGNIHVAEGSLDQVSASFHAAPKGALTDLKTPILFEGQAAVKGLALADPALGQAIGRDVTLAMRGSASPGGEAMFEKLELVAADFDANYTGILGGKRIQGRLDLVARDLSRFARLAGVALKGEARIGADLDGAPRYGALTATIEAQASRLATGYAILDRVTGGDLGLNGVARLTSGGGFAFSDLLATGAHGSARLNGAFKPDKVDLNASIDVPRAQFLDPRISGAAAVAVTLTGAPTDLNANVKASLSAGRLLDRETSGLTLEAQVSHIPRLVEAAASLSGEVDNHPLRGSVHVARRADGAWVADDLVLSLASARLAGALTVSADRVADGELTFGASNLDDLSPLVLMKLSGAVQARLSASDSAGRQALAIVADSARMSVGANTFEGIKVDLKVGDLWGAGDVSGLARLSRAEIAGASISNIRLAATALDHSSDLDFSGSVRGLAVKARGQLSGGPPARLELASLSARGAGRSVALSGPATLTFGRDGVDIRDFALRVDSGRLSLDGHAGSTLDLRAKAVGLPLAAIDIVSPGLGLSGVADGDAAIAGTPADPSGDWRLRLKGVRTPLTTSMSAPALDVAGSGKLSGGRTTLDVTVNAGPGAALRLTGSSPLSSDGALDLAIDGKLDAALANSAISASGRRVTGALAIALKLRGTPAKPRADGTIRLAGGEFRDDETGFRLSALNGVLQANGDTLRIDRLGGTTPNGGSIAATGEVRLDPAAGFPGSIRLTGSNAQLASNSLVTATANLGLTLAGRLAQRPNIDGRITILSMEISVPDRFDSVAAPIPGTKHRNPTPTARARLAELAKAKAARGRGPLFDATLALTVSAANRIFVRGRGINVEAAGDLRVAGSARDPQITGGFDLLSGSLSLLGRRLDFTHGRVRFDGDTTPELNLVAETNAGGVTARIAVTGPASQPAFAITSNPSLPEDEILSRVLFDKGSGSLSPFQALQLANAVSSFTGHGDAFEQLRRSLGIGGLDIGSSTGGGPLVGLGRAINDRIQLNVNTGVTPQDNGVSMDLDVTRHIRLQAGVDASGGSSAGVGAEWQYK